MLIELIRPTTPDLARRWLAALLIAPEEERAGIVEAVEARMDALYESAERDRAIEAKWLHISEPEVQRDGYTETVIRTYERADHASERSRDTPPLRGSISS